MKMLTKSHQWISFLIPEREKIVLKKRNMQKQMCSEKKCKKNMQKCFSEIMTQAAVIPALLSLSVLSYSLFKHITRNLARERLSMNLKGIKYELIWTWKTVLGNCRTFGSTASRWTYLEATSSETYHSTSRGRLVGKYVSLHLEVVQRGF